MLRFTRGCLRHCPPQHLAVFSNPVTHHLHSPMEGTAVNRIDIDRSRVSRTSHYSVELPGIEPGSYGISLKASPCVVRYASTRIS